MIGPLVSLLAFAVALGVLVFVHELGHFMVAKRLGILVQRFSIGFGPVIFSRRRGETEYALSAMPLGGYVKMLGEEDETDPAVVAEPERAFSTQPARRRAAIVFAGPAMNFVFAFVVYAVLFATVGAEMPSHEARIGGVTAGMPAEHAGLKLDDRVIAIDDRPIATWEELSHSVLGSEGRRLRLTVEHDGDVGAQKMVEGLAGEVFVGRDEDDPRRGFAGLGDDMEAVLRSKLLDEATHFALADDGEWKAHAGGAPVVRSWRTMRE